MIHANVKIETGIHIGKLIKNNDKYNINEALLSRINNEFEEINKHESTRKFTFM